LPTELFPAAQAINSIRKVKIDQVRSVETEKRQFGAERSEFEKIEASAQQMPSFIEFSVQPHPELERRVYRYRVNILPSGTEPMFRFTQIGKEIADAQLLEEFRAKVSSTLDAALQDIMDREDPIEGVQLSPDNYVRLFSGVFKP
jgi:uncharacterized protein YfdQ (DUF2303 family)